LSQIICPLCSKFNSLRYFDPSRNELDIFVVDVRGLGRGKGVEVIGRTSVLNDSIVLPIRDRCIELIRIIDQKHPPIIDDKALLQRELETWKKGALELRKWGNDLEAQRVNMESRMLHWKRKAQNIEKRSHDLAARAADDESTISRWIIHCDDLRVKINALTDENRNLVNKIESMREEEQLAVEEMDELLEMINESVSSDFRYLADAVMFLLEVG
jgi:hypothetical protein